MARYIECFTFSLFDVHAFHNIIAGFGVICVWSAFFGGGCGTVRHSLFLLLRPCFWRAGFCFFLDLRNTMHFIAKKEYRDDFLKLTIIISSSWIRERVHAVWGGLRSLECNLCPYSPLAFKNTKNYYLIQLICDFIWKKITLSVVLHPIHS